MQYLKELKEIEDSLLFSPDNIVLQYVRFRKDIKIPNLAARVRKVTDDRSQTSNLRDEANFKVDLVHNMLLNP